MFQHFLTVSVHPQLWIGGQGGKPWDAGHSVQGSNHSIIFYKVAIIQSLHLAFTCAFAYAVLYDDFQERTFLIYELYIATIATVCGGIFFGIISAMMAIVNTASNPIEAICHIPGWRKEISKIWKTTKTLPGLYLWNGIALCSSMASVITWMVQFYLRLTHNVLIRDSRWPSSNNNFHDLSLTHTRSSTCLSFLSIQQPTLYPPTIPPSIQDLQSKPSSGLSEACPVSIIIIMVVLNLFSHVSERKATGRVKEWHLLDSLSGW